MPTRIPPDALLVQTNLSGVLAAITDDPDSPDGTWLTAISDGSNTDLRVSFPTPASAPIAGVGLQNFRCLLRTTGPGDDPIARVFLYESGVLRATGTPTAISSEAGQIVQLSWNASLLVDPTGAGVECRVQGIADGGILDPDDTVEVGAVEWNAEVVFVASADYRSSLGSNSAYVAAPSAAPDYHSSSGGNSAYVGEPEFGPDFAFRSSLGSNSTYEAIANFCPTDDERLPPTTVLEQTNLAGDLDQIQDDPDTPDGSWWTTPLPGTLLPTAARVGFDTPAEPLCEGEQEFRALVRSTALGIPPPGLLAPTARIELWEDSGAVVDPNFYRDTVLADNPQAYWRLGEAAGTTLVDETGNHPGTYVGAPTLGVPGALADTPDTGVHFEPTTQYAVVPYSPALNPAMGPNMAPFSFEAWAKPDSVPVGGVFVVGNSGATGGWEFSYRNVQGLGAIIVWEFAFLGAQPVTTPATRGSYSHIVGVWTGATLELYVNGILTGAISVVNSPPNAESPFAIANTSRGFPFGPSTTFDGDIDEVSFYDYALTPLQVAAHYDAGIAPGSTRIASSPEFAVTSDTGQLISWSWSPSLLSDPTGADVEARIVGTPAVLDTVGWTVELGAVEWNVAACAGCRYRDSQGGNSTYEPGPLAFSADYRDSQGSNSAFEAIFGPGGVGYVSSDGSNSTYDPDVGEVCVVTGSSTPSPSCTVSGSP